MSIDSLALVSKIMFEERILAQRQEIETLKLDILKRDYSAKLLQVKTSETIFYYETDEIKPNCACIHCMKFNMKRGAFYDTEDPNRPAVCVFKIRFESFLTECDMTFGVAESVVPSAEPMDPDTYQDEEPDAFTVTRESENYKPMICEATHSMIDTRLEILPDVHFVQRKAGSWEEFQYGPKLLNAKTVNNPEIQKLKRLFDLVHANGRIVNRWLVQ
jgi:hypothetical protein